MKLTASGSSTTAFGFGMLQIARYEEQGIGLQWDNFFLPPDNAQQFSTLHVFIMMIADFIFYILLTYYFQQVKNNVESCFFQGCSIKFRL